LQSPLQDSGNKNNKEWFLPNMSKNHQTYIDHGCTLDRQGYPIYPNGQTTFLRIPGDDLTNFGTTAFSKQAAVNTRGQGKWKVTQFHCLGVLTCDNPECHWAGPPPTAHGEIAKVTEK
jgi:hypothetical protein